MSFGEKFPEAVIDFKAAWVEYMKYCYQMESGDLVESVGENRQIKTLITLDRDAKGYPLVPLPKEDDTLAHMKRVIRSFITAHYRKFHRSFSSYNAKYPQVLLLAGDKIGSHGN